MRPESDTGSSPVTTPAAPGRDRITWILGALLVVAFGLRLIGIRSGLPFAFNPDEELHFVPNAAAAADGHLNPGYYENPAALTYLLALVYRVIFPASDLTDLHAEHPALTFLVARIVVALLGTLLVYLVYLVGRRAFDRTVGLVAAAVIGLAYLPVYYSHQALNDVPTLLPVTVALLGSLLTLDEGRPRHYLLAGVAVGVAFGTKYLAAPMCLVVALAALLRVVAKRERPGRAIGWLVAAGGACIAAIAITNPYLILDFGEARGQFLHQSGQAGGGKLGQSGTGWTYYPVTLLWGYGALPLLFAILGAGLALREERTRGVLLTFFPVLLYLYMAGQGRFFGRWMLPAYPMLAVLTGYGVVRTARWVRARRPVSGTAAAAAALPMIAALMLAQPALDALRSDVVLSRADTRTQAHDWLAEHLPSGRIVVEPSFPADYLSDLPGLEAYPVERPFQNYEEDLEPALLNAYRSGNYCWVLVTSHQRDRGLAEGLANAAAYYDRLEDESEVRAEFTPYRSGSDAPPFSFDFSFNWYPPAYERPGPQLAIHHLTDCQES